MAKQTKMTDDPEIVAMSIVYSALKDLDADARVRVLNFVSGRLNISGMISSEKEQTFTPVYTPPSVVTNETDDELEGISPVGKKWITRSGIAPSKLMSIFSLGIDEIDLVSKTVPGNTKSQRMKNVFLLKGIAAYLGTGSARFTHEQIKEAGLHYDAWDVANFSNIFKTMAADVSGSKDAGYSLTPKGISEATILVKQMLGTEA